jgi:hypothetical protein
MPACTVLQKDINSSLRAYFRSLIIIKRIVL